MTDEQMHLLAQELGPIVEREEQCPGVYYLAVESKDGESRFATEFYLVFDNAPISQEVRAMGTALETVPALSYPIDTYENARWAVHYEILRYKTKQGLPLPEGEGLQDTALYGMERCPSYFGTYPVPFVTPWGYTLRHRRLDNGIYWIETDQCVEVLAVCNPVWDTELSDGALSIAQRLEYEGAMGYRYFTKPDSCVVIFELLKTHPEWTGCGLIHRAQLMNAIWKYHPEYAMGYTS